MRGCSKLEQPHFRELSSFGLIVYELVTALVSLAKCACFAHSYAMQSHELLREVFQKASAKQAASELGLSLSMIYKWAESPGQASGSGTANPLDRIEALHRCTGDLR